MDGSVDREVTKWMDVFIKIKKKTVMSPLLARLS